MPLDRQSDSSREFDSAYKLRRFAETLIPRTIRSVSSIFGDGFKARNDAPPIDIVFPFPLDELLSAIELRLGAPAGTDDDGGGDTTGSGPLDDGDSGDGSSGNSGDSGTSGSSGSSGDSGDFSGGGSGTSGDSGDSGLSGGGGDSGGGSSGGGGDSGDSGAGDSGTSGEPGSGGSGPGGGDSGDGGSGDGGSGVSGMSGLSGDSGDPSGLSGDSGDSGLSGDSGESGLSGDSGEPSGLSGIPPTQYECMFQFNCRTAPIGTGGGSFFACNPGSSACVRCDNTLDCADPTKFQYLCCCTTSCPCTVPPSGCGGEIICWYTACV